MIRQGLRWFGALLLALGLVVGGLAFLGGTASAAPSSGTADICNNQKNDPTKDCVGGNHHGTAAWSFESDGDLFIDVGPVGDFGGWSGVKVCIPYSSTPSQSADCTGSSPTVLPGSSYQVDGVSGKQVEDKSVSFSCDNDFTITVPAANLPDVDTFSFALHFSPCAGGTDEAFGTTTKPSDSELTYQCGAPTNVTSTSATLNASTNDEGVVRAVFTLGGQDHEDTSSDAGAFSVNVSGLSPDTSYTYTVTFFNSETQAGSTTCAFATPTAARTLTYACTGATGVDHDSATLGASTDDQDATKATFTLNGVDSTDTSKTGQAFSVDVAGLTPDTAYSYSVAFLDAGDNVVGRASGTACAFRTTGAPQVTVIEQPRTDAPAQQSAVLGATVDAPAPAPAPAPAVAPAAVQQTALAATGADTTTGLLYAALSLVVFGLGILALTRRPQGAHYLR